METNTRKWPVRTGVTVILPKGKTDKSYSAAWFSLIGDGELTGLPYVEDYGSGYGSMGIPILIVSVPDLYYMRLYPTIESLLSK
ncbi:P1 family peptidase [Dyadobacter psychrotolerans]|uniref:P1 family peptidase n=1 Tax=Dyadobacter psychrotolerans TaxID=2541721 RepID=UPI0014053CE8|nr:P1 family peptidase [Dyadobacter psychrotolerans]